MTYKIRSRVVRLEQKTRIKGVYRTGKTGPDGKPEFHQEDEVLGWFATFDGSRECLFLGLEKPVLHVGQEVWIRIEPVA